MKFVTFFTFTLCSLTPLPPTSQSHRTRNFLNSCYTCLLHSMFCFISSYILAWPSWPPWHPPVPDTCLLHSMFCFISPYILYSAENHVLFVTICYGLWKLMYILQSPMYKLKSLEPEWSSLIPSQYQV